MCIRDRILAIAAFGLMYYVTRASVSTTPTVPSNGTQVVVAKIAIPSGTLITAAMLEETRIKGVLPINAYTNCLELVDAPCATTVGVSSSQPSVTTASNYYAVVSIAPNTLITQDLVSVNRATQSPTFGNLNLPAGDVAISIPITAQEAVAGYLQAGDHIDIVGIDKAGDTDSVSYTHLNSVPTAHWSVGRLCWGSAASEPGPTCTPGSSSA